MQRGFGLAQRGAVIPLVAIMLSVLMGFGGMAVDIGFLEYQQQAQQAATDAAAEGGAAAAYANNCANATAAIAAAKTDAATNGYSSSGGIVAGNSGNNQVTVTSPPVTGPYAGNACAVAVSITTNKQTFFSRIFGFNAMAETTQAVGVGSQTANVACLYALSTTEGQSNLSNMTISTPHCKMYLNDGANMSNSSFNANFIGYTGGNNTSGASFASASPTSEGIVADPCPNYAGCNWLTNNALPTSGCTSMGSMVYGPGATGQQIGSASTPTCYGNLSISGTQTVCGLIEVTGSQFQLNGSNLSTCSSGVTFALGPNVQTINFSTATLNLFAPTSGNTEGVTIWRNSSQGSSVNFSNCTCNITGMVYFPTAQVTYSSAGAAYTLMIFGQVNFSTSTLNMGNPPQPYAGSVATLGQ